MAIAANSSNVSLDLADLVGMGDRGRKRVCVDFAIALEQEDKIQIQCLDTTPKRENSAGTQTVRKMLEQAFGFEETYWNPSEWRKMLGQEPCNWVERVLLLCRAQVRGIHCGPQLKEHPFVLLPDGAVFSTRLLRPHKNLAQNPLLRVPTMIILRALSEFSARQPREIVACAGKKDAQPASSPPSRKVVAHWLEQWLCEHSATRWWLQGVKPGEDEKNVHSVTENHVSGIFEALEKAGLERFRPCSPRKRKRGET